MINQKWLLKNIYNVTKDFGLKFFGGLYSSNNPEKYDKFNKKTKQQKSFLSSKSTSEE